MSFIQKHRKAIIISAALLLVLGSIYYWAFAYPFRGQPFNAQRHGNPPLTPRWALECWLWEDDINTADYVDTLANGYAEHDFPVRTLLLDSPWSMRYNDFDLDTVRYPREWFRRMEEKGYRIVLWMTSMVNAESPDTRITDSRDWYEMAKSKGYLAESSHLNKWWKGKGGYLDYSNPEAVAWWRGMQQQMFDLGIDGWKLDGAATLFANMWGPVPIFYKKTHAGWMTTREYMDHYYRDEYLHGLTQNPEFITLSRSIDQWVHPEGFAPMDAAPVTWVGDQRHQWKSNEAVQEEHSNKDLVMDGIKGFEMALENILEAAQLGYCVIGSDVAGYQGGYIPPRLYIRWAQFSTFCGLFLNGGHGERAMWKRTPEELEIIRRYSWLHTELIPYMYTYVVQAHHGGQRLQTPTKEGKYQYLFGNDFLVAPIYEDSPTRTVVLPSGKWRYFFDDARVLEGKQTLTQDYSLDEFPLYIKEGAIVPLDVKRSYTRLGNELSEGYLTWLIYPGVDNRFTHYGNSLEETTVSTQNDNETLIIRVEKAKHPHILRVHLDKAPQKVTLDHVEVPFDYNETARKLTVKTDNYTEGIYHIVR